MPLAVYGNMPYTAGMANISDKKERLEARVPASLKEDLLRAASLQRKTLTEFIVENLSKATREAIESHASWQLSQLDSVAFVDALLNPPAPNAKLQAAARRFRQNKSS